MTIQTLTRANAGILGDGIEAQSLIALYARLGVATRPRVVSRARPATLPEDVEWRRETDADAFDGCEVIVRSPSVSLTHPLLARAMATATPVTSCTNLFLHDADARGVPVIGITGSKGKSTTTLLVQALLALRGLRVAVAGNIGRPGIDLLPVEVDALDAVVCEMSSYQCADLSCGPAHAVLLDLFPEHMDWHGTVEAYYRAKLRIVAHQPAPARVTFSERVPRVLAEHGLAIAGRVVNTDGEYHARDGAVWRGTERLFDTASSLLRGAHNMANACVALAATEFFGVDWHDLERALAEFQGLPHRLQSLGVVQGIAWIDDSASTAPEATVAALQALDGRTDTLITGGLDRGYDVSALARYLARSGVRTVACMPDTGWRLADVLADSPARRVIKVRGVEEAVALAAACTPVGGTCVFAPGAPSYGTFQNFYERGRVFQAAVAALGVVGKTP